MESYLHNVPRETSAGASKMPTRALLYFALLTFAITWGIAGSYIFFPNQAEALFGKMEGLHPLFFLGTWGPGLAGILVVLFYGGRKGLSAFMSRLLIWRCDIVWWVLVLIGFPLIFMAGSLIKGGPLLAPLPPEGVMTVFMIAAVMLFLGPMEEFGWRGVAQPLLQRHIAPIWAGAIIGAVWGVWHLPAFYLSGAVHADWNFPLFFVGCIILGILVTPIFNKSRGSLLLPILFHWQLIIPFWPDAQPWDTILLAALTVVVIWLNRDAMFSRDGVVTEVFPGET